MGKNGSTTDKLDVKKTLFISFGFFASSIAWSVYNAYVPQLLQGFVASTTMIGLIMTLDNVFGVIFQPLFGKLSDKTRTRFGRRMPYIMIGIPICAITFTIIPDMPNLWSLMLVLIVFTFVMSAWRTPSVSLMPDVTPQKFQSQANGIVNLLGGVGSLIAFLVGGILFNIGGFPLPFLVSAACMVAALVILLLFVREPDVVEVDKEEKTDTKAKLSKEEKKSLILILFGVFFWFSGYNAVETFFTLYATNAAGMNAGEASMTLSIFSLTFLSFAVPSGFIGAKIGRRKTILIGLAGVAACFIPLIFFANVWMVRISLFIGGFFWACVNINSLPMVTRLSGKSKIGTYIGYYYFFSFSSQIVSPILFGFIRDMVGRYEVLFTYSAIAFLLALVCLFMVHHGEEGEEDSTNATEILGQLED